MCYYKLTMSDLHYFRIEVGVNEIRVIWKPANGKNRGDRSKHLDHLINNKDLVNCMLNLSSIILYVFIIYYTSLSYV